MALPASSRLSHPMSQVFHSAMGQARPSGHLPSVWERPGGSFIAGIPVEEKARETILLRAWCHVNRPGACLHTKAWRPPHPRGTVRCNPSRRATTTQIASSYSRRPQEAIGKAISQSPLCLAIATRKRAFCCALLLLLSLFFRPRYSIPKEEKLCYAKTKYKNKLEWSLHLLLLHKTIKK